MKTHTKTLFMLLLASLFMMSCSGTDNTTMEESDQFVANARANIIGSWSFTYTETQCEERYVFSRDGSFSQTSLDEALVGSYQIEQIENSGIQLSLQPTQDNLGTDCLGSSEDSTTRNFTFVISFPVNDQMDWARTSDPGLVIVSLNRL